MNVLSLFDGMSCGQLALQRAGIKYDNYYASEIDKYAIKVTQANFPDTIQIGDIRKISTKTIYLSEVYSYICNKYFKNELSNLQGIISEWEMLHRINEEQSFAAYFGTQISDENTKTSEHTSLSINDRIWFFKCKMGDNKPVYDIIRCGERRKATNTIDVAELCKHSFWWNGNGQHESEIKGKGFKGNDRKECERRHETKIKNVGDSSIFNTRIEEPSEGTSVEAISKSRNETKLSGGYSENRSYSSSGKEETDGRNEKTKPILNNEAALQASDEVERISKDNWVLLPIYNEIQVTVIECQWGVLAFKGVFNFAQAGSPCQGFSFAGKQLNFEDERSKLFFEYARLLKECKPKYFLLENVKMKKEYQAIISEHLGVQPIEINSALVSAQNRKRLYWTNIPVVKQPEDKGILLKDIIEHGEVDREKSYCIDANYYKGGSLKNYLEKSRRQLVLSQPESRLMVKQLNISKECAGTQPSIQNRVYDIGFKSPSLMANMSGTVYKILDSSMVRKLTCTECERLQTIPDNFTNHVSNTQRYKMLGNGWTADVVAHIFSYLKS